MGVTVILSELSVFALSLLFILESFTPTDGSPVAAVNISDFSDYWNYQISPHNSPLLSGDSRNHILPAEAEIRGEETSNTEPSIKKIESRTAKKLGDAVRSRVSCSVCKLATGLLLKEIIKNTSFEEMRTKFVDLCVAFHVENEIVCSGIYDVYAPAVLPALKTSRLGSPEICGLVLGEVCKDMEIPGHDWNITFPHVDKPPVQKPEIPASGLPTFKVLHLTDTHYDPEYAVGAPANCEEPLCCHTGSTPPKEQEVLPAGKWGSYAKCDVPRSLLENMLRNIAEQHPDIDYIIWTGDLVPHDIWNQTKDGNLAIIQDTVEMMFEFFPKTPIFPVLGNHESVPAGNFAPPWMQNEDHSVSWLYHKMADHWRKWLPASAGNTVLHGGFYSILIRPGFRIISLNTNYCHSLSWWLLVNSTDPAQELQWLTFELQEAENHGEKVHLIGHIAPGASDCMKVWSRNFNMIVERYENTISGMFYGHSHADEFEVFYEVAEEAEKRRPVGVAYLGPSVTTFENYNPAYRIYYVDGEHDNGTTKEVLDHETWTMNLEEANKNDKDPEWYRLYSVRKDFQMDSLRPESWAKFIDRLVENPNLFDQFYKYYYRDSPTKPECDSKCKLQILCDLKSGRSHQKHMLCHDLELQFG